MKSGLAVSWVLVAACGFDAPKGVRIEPDAPPLLPDACVSFSAQLDTCTLPQGIQLMLGGAMTFDTNTGVLVGPSSVIPVVSVPVMTLGGEVRALVATKVEFDAGSTLIATGIRGFAIVASENITMRANVVIDVSAGGAGFRGDCGAGGPTVGEDDTDGAAGGGGAGFGDKGGKGGDGDNDGGKSDGGNSGDKAADDPAGPLGGCPGAAGGRNTGSAIEGGAGGKGGGAVYLISAVAIGIATGAGINAGGEGGGGGLAAGTEGDAGGGGGGSGGSIFLEAPVIRSEGTLAANGGAGGEGSDGGAAGRRGAPGALAIGPAMGGSGGAPAGADGGSGGHRAATAGAAPAMVLNGGGGGGGGSVGFIRVRSADAQLGANVSPEPR